LNPIKDYFEEKGIEVDIEIEERNGQELTKSQLKENPLLLCRYYVLFFGEFATYYLRMTEKDKKQFRDFEELKRLYSENIEIFNFLYVKNSKLLNSNGWTVALKNEISNFVFENHAIISNFFNLFWEVLE